MFSWQTGWQQSLLWRRVARGAGWLLGGNALATGLTAVRALILAKLLGATQYGTLGLIIAAGAIFTRLVEFRSGEAVIKYVNHFLTQGQPARATAVTQTTFFVDLVGSLGSCLLMISTAPLAATWLTHDAANVPLIRLYALTLLLAAPSGTAVSLLRLSNQYGRLATQDAGLALLQLVGSVAILWTGGGLYHLIFFLVATATIQAGLHLWLWRQAAHALHLPPWQTAPLQLLREQRREIGRFLLATNLTSTLKGVQSNLDTLLIGFWLGPAVTGYYRLARNAAQLFAFPVNPLYQVAYPEFARLWQQPQQLRRFFWQMVLLSAGFGVVAGTAVYLTAPWLIRTFLDPDYLAALPVFNLLLIGIIIILASQYLHALLLAGGRAAPTAWGYAIGVAAQVAVLAATLPTIGLIGAGYAFIIFAATRALWLAWVGRDVTRYATAATILNP
ncbi:MAG: oligosaccharide flippase family protein [Anaerolineales bacterium]|nr:oligosaccharide flippase family protein [Anaerolineales bacterium]